MRNKNAGVFFVNSMGVWYDLRWLLVKILFRMGLDNLGMMYSTIALCILLYLTSILFVLVGWFVGWFDSLRLS